MRLLVLDGPGVDEVPDFVFLAHVVDVMQSLHVPFVLRTFASTPFSVQLFLLPMWPFAFLVMLAMWVWSKTFVISCYNLRGRLHQIWAVPRYGFQVRFLCCVVSHVMSCDDGVF